MFRNAVNQGLATLAFFGVNVNLVLFLTRVLQQSNAVAANNVSNGQGLSTSSLSLVHSSVTPIGEDTRLASSSKPCSYS